MQISNGKYKLDDRLLASFRHAQREAGLDPRKSVWLPSKDSNAPLPPIKKKRTRAELLDAAQVSFATTLCLILSFEFQARVWVTSALLSHRT